MKNLIFLFLSVICSDRFHISAKATAWKRTLFHILETEYKPAHMGPEDNFRSTKMSKDSVLAKFSDLKKGPFFLPSKYSAMRYGLGGEKESCLLEKRLLCRSGV